MISNKYNLLKSTILCIGASETSKLSIKHLIKKDKKKYLFQIEIKLKLRILQKFLI